MLAILVTVFIPALPILIWKCCNKDKKLSKGEILIRYTAYGLFILLLTCVMLAFLSDESASFWTKISMSGEFALKYICMVTAAAVAAAAAEWIYVAGKANIEGIRQKYDQSKLAVFCRRYVGSIALYGLAVLVVVLNVSLMFDNVLWGDECFSANTAEKSMFGIMQVMYYWDSHPPLYYYWLKLFGEVFGFSVPVLHLASLVPFVIGILLAVTVFRRRFGNLSAGLFVMISGLGPACLEYNLEVRMYALAFLCIWGCYYCSYRIIRENRRSLWIAMVFLALAAAYTHYYALVSAGIMLFFNGVAVCAKYRGKSWLKGLGSIIAFIIGYSPWLGILLSTTSDVSENWWETKVLGLDKSLGMALGNNGLIYVMLPLWLILLVTLLLAESNLFKKEKQGEQLILRLQRPSVKNWSDETYAMVVGALTIAGTVAFAYLLCLVVGPVLVDRYLYPVCAVTIVMLVIGSGRVLKILKEFCERRKVFALEGFAKAVLAMLLLIMFLLGLSNYKEYRADTEQQDALTNQTLETIGEPAADVPLVSNGVKHLGWTVLYHYYPEHEIINGNYESTDADAFWYFTPYELGDADMQTLQNRGYTVSYMGYMQIATYPFDLYYIEKGEAVSANQWTVTQYGPRDTNSSFYTIYHPEQGLIAVDGGWAEDAAYVKEMIKAQGGEVDAWILTHPHQDHIGAFNEIYKELQTSNAADIQIKEIYTVDMATPEECLAVASWDSADAYNDFLALGITDLNYVYPGDELTICGLEFDIYNAYDENVKSLSRDYLNDGSMMFKVTGETESFLFCADVGDAMSDFLLEKWGQELQADYLQMGHHGYGGLRDDFYEMAAPSVAFFDAPDWLMYDTTGKYDNPEHAALMEGMGSEVVSFNSAPNSVILR